MSGSSSKKNELSVSSGLRTLNLQAFFSGLSNVKQKQQKQQANDSKSELSRSQKNKSRKNNNAGNNNNNNNQSAIDKSNPVSPKGGVPSFKSGTSNDEMMYVDMSAILETNKPELQVKTSLDIYMGDVTPRNRDLNNLNLNLNAGNQSVVASGLMEDISSIIAPFMLDSNHSEFTHGFKNSIEFMLVLPLKDIPDSPLYNMSTFQEKAKYLYSKYIQKNSVFEVCILYVCVFFFFFFVFFLCECFFCVLACLCARHYISTHRSFFFEIFLLVVVTRQTHG